MVLKRTHDAFSGPTTGDYSFMPLDPTLTSASRGHGSTIRFPRRGMKAQNLMRIETGQFPSFVDYSHSHDLNDRAS